MNGNKGKKKLRITVLILSVVLVTVMFALDRAGVVDFDGDGVFSDFENSDILTVSFLDVGQGDCAFIQSGGETMMIDTGENSAFPVVEDFADSNNIDCIDYIIATHFDSDHTGALKRIVESYEVKNLFVSNAYSSFNSSAFTDCVNTAKKNATKVVTLSGEGSISFGNAVVNTFAPSYETENENDLSIIAKVVFKDTSFLFTGDAEKAEENLLIKNGFDLKSDVLKVAHHGSDTSSSQPFLKAVSPQFFVISVGENNDYGHPNEKCLDRLYEFTDRIYRTDICGTVTAVSDGAAITFSIKN
ncbi:MAG: MBL fold metallo-hydrolase [Clostridiales bacterium]|nr:MBL fold metallo-hydrolase [Clostridiales bacterium]